MVVGAVLSLSLGWLLVWTVLGVNAVRFQRPLNLTDADARAFLSTISLIVKTGRDVCDERLKPKILTAAFDPFRERLLVVSDQHAHVNGSVFAFDAVANGRFVVEAETAVELHPERFVAVFGKHRRRSVVVSRGWLDDQIKFAVGLREAFIRHPDSSWFVIVDDDTFCRATVWRACSRRLTARVRSSSATAWCLTPPPVGEDDSCTAAVGSRCRAARCVFSRQSLTPASSNTASATLVTSRSHYACAIWASRLYMSLDFKASRRQTQWPRH